MTSSGSSELSSTSKSSAQETFSVNNGTAEESVTTALSSITAQQAITKHCKH